MSLYLRAPENTEKMKLYENTYYTLRLSGKETKCNINLKRKIMRNIK